jgi:NADH-quinone oxidoreductase subunit L
MSDEALSATWIRFVPLLPLGVAIVHGVMIGLLRRTLSFRAATLVTLGAVAAACVFSALAFAELIGDTGDGAIVDRMGTWIGVGVGRSTLVVDWALRFDPLAAVMCLVVTGVGLLALVHAVGELSVDTRDDRGEQRFYALACLQLAAMLLLVLADDGLLLVAAWTLLGMTTWWLLGYRYTDEHQQRTAMVGLVVGRAGDAALFAAVAILFWAQAFAEPAAAASAGLAAVRPALAGAVLPLPAILGGGALPAAEAVAALVLVAIVTRAAQLPLSGWLAESVGAPIASLVLVHTVTTVAAPILLGARFAFLFVDAPVVASAAAWIGATSAFVCALIACAQTDAIRVLTWSTVSQVGYALVALGVAAPTAAVLHVVAHAFHKALILMAMGAVVAAVGGERDLWRMGNLGSRLWRTRIDTWIAVLSIGGVLPVTIGFFSLEQVVVATSAAPAASGGGYVMWLLLLAVAATGFYIVRLIYLSLYGETRISPQLRWEDLEDPRPVVLWPMGVLAALTVGGALIGTPQTWADLLVAGVDEANSLHHFIAPSLGTPVEPALASLETWTAAGRTIGMSLLGALPAVWLYLYRPGWLDVASARLGGVQRALASGLRLEPGLRRVLGVPLVAIGDRVLDRAIERPVIEGGTLRGSAWLLHLLANGWLRRLQSGSVSLYVILVTLASLGLVAYLVTAGGG